jgi:hypothetical protein
VSIARSGKDALDRLPECRPDVVLLDLTMPEMDGFEFLGRLRLDSAFRELPVIVLTSALPDPRRRASLSGTPILSKSDLSPEALIDAIGGVLRTDAGAGAA